MKSKAFIPGDGSFYIVDAKTCPQCKKTMLIYSGCACKDTKWEELKKWVECYTYHVPQPFILSKMREIEEK
jgi:hypothetical protein